MDKVVEKVVKQIQSINNISRKVIKYGFIMFLICLFVSLVLAIVNKQYLGNIYQVNMNSIDIFKASFSVLAITTIGGLVMDYISKNG